MIPGTGCAPLGRAGLSASCRVLIAALAVVLLPGASAGPDAPEVLEPDLPVERELAAGETHSYRLDLTDGGVWRVSVD